ncbi:hypothetical protein Saro_1078 [Novosphingobium aromaticivorans DSM 12444]|uniref:Pilus assembly protein CpaD n=1 Tax=Novosphingobium aromaticivorans (strain ATCC 700278 / DSM 12444 / CCUG 56034 / CIP 105152 / NBRC 16084 / F199) TaxID=279238 RepID=Q2G9F0_NOVAD|nr:CpaD family pilus assembly protein [Novosphingobium aromaticivorans]ABD25523.1 hypothetical protein Saro_1078 [Novosphingobium aromaticivorans DSM 12444]SCX96295.1 pilus assembly protein CpaD [Novosphingobium aromaticivorans]
MRHSLIRGTASAFVLSLGIALSACSSVPENRMLTSVHQPVVERNHFVFDLETLPGGGLSITEQRRLAGWFESLGLKYGDKIAVDDPLQSKATLSAVDAVAGRWGLMLADGAAPVTPGYVAPGAVRVVVTRATASVPGCPSWEYNSDMTLNNHTSTNFGCAVNSNLAAMVADKEHLIQGASGTGETVVMSSTKAIDSYRAARPTGEEGLKNVTTSSASGGSGGN